MIKIFFGGSILLLSLLAPFSRDLEISERPSNKQKQPTMLDRWNEAKHQAALATGAITSYPPPRRVKRSAKPEIIMNGSKIFFDGKLLELGVPLISWKNTIKRNPHCDETGIEWCVWQDLGLEVYTNEKDNLNVSTVVIMLSIPEDLLKETRNAHSDLKSKLSPKADWLARSPFTGYLEIDGFGIDKETKFWEFQSSIDINRNVHCGLRDCEFPGGKFGPGSIIDLHLNGSTESATIEEIQIYKIFH